MKRCALAIMAMSLAGHAITGKTFGAGLCQPGRSEASHARNSPAHHRETSPENNVAAAPQQTFRTDSSNPQSPWYRLTPGEFPPAGSEHRVRGELVAADFIHRTGQYRSQDKGELVNFTLLPYSVAFYLNAEADLRDIPLGTHLEFFLYQDEKGEFSKAAALQDDFTQLARQGTVLRIMEMKDGGTKLSITRQKPGENVEAPRIELPLTDQTIIWKEGQRIKPDALAAGDELLANFSQSADHLCTEVWVGVNTQKAAAEKQRKKHQAFIRYRGIASRIDRVEGKNLVITLFGDPVSVRAFCKDENIVPEEWAHHDVRSAVANEELRTYNPPVDNQGSEVVAFHAAPTDNYGSSGIQLTITPRLLLEGFRKGRIIRIFAQSWPIDDMPFGETLYTERPGAKMEEESPNQYSYRTDFGNEQLPWYQLKPAEFPPFQSQHNVTGELLKVDPMHRAGQFRTDETGTIVDFTMPAFGTIMYLNAEAEFSELPLGRRYYFSLYQDEKSAFTRAGVVMDDFTWLSRENVTCRVEAVRPGEGKIFVANQLAIIKDDKDHDVRPPDLSHAEFNIDKETRVWKAGKQIALTDISVGDELLVNLTGSTTTMRSRCAEIWVGLDTHKAVAEERRNLHASFLKEHGMPGWIQNINGKTVAIDFFAARRRDFLDVKQGEPYGQPISVKLADDDLHPIDDRLDAWRLKENLPERDTFGTYGSSGVRWVLEADKLPDGYQKGRAIRVFKPEWLPKAAGK